MNLSNEAAYLYVFSKKLKRLNKQLHYLSKKAEKHLHKHQTASSERKKEKQKQKHHRTIDNIKELMKQHNDILRRIHHHQIAFAHALQKEHKIKT